MHSRTTDRFHLLFVYIYTQFITCSFPCINGILYAFCNSKRCNLILQSNQVNSFLLFLDQPIFFPWFLFILFFVVTTFDLLGMKSLWILLPAIFNLLNGPFHFWSLVCVSYFLVVFLAKGMLPFIWFLPFTMELEVKYHSN